MMSWETREQVANRPWLREETRLPRPRPAPARGLITALCSKARRGCRHALLDPAPESPPARPARRQETSYVGGPGPRQLSGIGAGTEPVEVLAGERHPSGARLSPANSWECPRVDLPEADLFAWSRAQDWNSPMGWAPTLAAVEMAPTCTRTVRRQCCLTEPLSEIEPIAGA